MKEQVSMNIQGSSIITYTLKEYMLNLQMSSLFLLRVGERATSCQKKEGRRAEKDLKIS
jgi:hypothetical protein